MRGWSAGFGSKGFGDRFWGPGFEVKGLGGRVMVSHLVMGFRVEGSGFRMQVLALRVWGVRIRLQSGSVFSVSVLWTILRLKF